MLQSSRHGLSCQEGMARLERFGPNILPRPMPPGIFTLILRQFLSLLIYILLIAVGIAPPPYGLRAAVAVRRNGEWQLE